MGLFVLGLMSGGEGFCPGELELFRDLARRGQAGMRGTPSLRGVKRALRDRFGPAGARERRDLANGAKEHQRFPHHTRAFRRGRVHPCSARHQGAVTAAASRGIKI
jgi:hypothetical protein